MTLSSFSVCGTKRSLVEAILLTVMYKLTVPEPKSKRNCGGRQLVRVDLAPPPFSLSPIPSLFFLPPFFLSISWDVVSTLARKNRDAWEMRGSPE